jgi:hypothetical protein
MNKLVVDQRIERGFSDPSRWQGEDHNRDEL